MKCTNQRMRSTKRPRAPACITGRTRQQRSMGAMPGRDENQFATRHEPQGASGQAKVAHDRRYWAHAWGGARRGSRRGQKKTCRPVASSGARRARAPEQCPILSLYARHDASPKCRQVRDGRTARVLSFPWQGGHWHQTQYTPAEHTAPLAGRTFASCTHGGVTI